MSDCIINSPLGSIKISGSSLGISLISFIPNESISEDIPSELIECVYQLTEYFEGKRDKFSVKLNLKGTDFQLTVWKELLNIPYGDTISYSDLANKIKIPKAHRAVGNANGKNKIPIIIPCHRVIAANGSIGGYSGGQDKKKFLLELESIFQHRKINLV